MLQIIAGVVFIPLILILFLTLADALGEVGALNPGFVIRALMGVEAFTLTVISLYLDGARAL